MNLHQLRFVREAVRQNYNLTDAAKALFTSQPGVSKAIIELEEELGVDIFTRHGKRIRGLTEPGRLVLESVELIMQEIDSLKRIGKEFAAQDSGSFTIATTHTQARYTLPKVVQAFMLKYPKVRLSLLQGNPRQIADMVQRDQADLAIATESIASVDGLITLPCYQWEHVVVVPPDHPLLKSKAVSLEEIATYPLITYDSAFAGRSKIDHAFRPARAEAGRAAGSDRRRRHQDLCRTGHGRWHHSGHGLRSGARQEPARHSGRPPVRHEHVARGGQAGRLPAQLYVYLHRAAGADPEPQDWSSRP